MRSLSPAIRPSARKALGAASVLLVGSGCAALIGADFDRELSSDAGDGGVSLSKDAQGDREHDSRSEPVGDAEAGPAPPPPACGNVDGFEPKSPWPTLGFCNTRVGRSNAPSLQKPKIRWHYVLGSLDSNDIFFSAPVVAADGSVYLNAIRSTEQDPWLPVLVCVKDGVERFVAPLPVEKYRVSFESSPSIGADGTLYVASFGVLSAWTKAGVSKWSASLGDAPASSPTLLGDGTIVVLGEQSVRAFDPSGTPRWTYSATNDFFGTLAVTPAGLLVAAERFTLGGALHILSTAGTRVAKSDLPREPETVPLVDGAGRIVLRTDRSSYVFSKSGEVELQKSTDSYATAALATLAPPLVWFTGWSPSTLDLASGATATPFPDESSPTPAVAYADGTLAIGFAGGNQLRLDGVSNDGKIAWSVLLDHSGADRLAPALGSDGTVYIAAGNHLYAVGE